MHPPFDQPDLARAVESLPLGEVERLPFGAIRLDDNGVVLFCNATELKQSGSGPRARLGLDFFAQVAPCMDTDDYRGRIERARANGLLDLEFTHIGDFDDPDRELTVRIQSASAGGVWIFMRREA